MIRWLMLCLLFTPALARAQDASLNGTVRDSRGAVLAGVTITATNKATSEARSTTSNGDGFWGLPGIPAGTYDVTAFLSGFATMKMEGVKLTSGQSSTLDIVLPIGDSSLGTIGGTVTSAGRPVPGAIVTARIGSQKKGEAVADGQGKYRIEALPPGDYTVTATAPNYKPSSKSVKLKERQNLTLDFALEKNP